MINRLSWADIINKWNENKKVLDQYPESGADYTYENAFHAVVIEKFNELIEKINELELNQIMSKPVPTIIYPYVPPTNIPYYPIYYPYGFPYTTCGSPMRIDTTSYCSGACAVGSHIIDIKCKQT